MSKARSRSWTLGGRLAALLLMAASVPSPSPAAPIEREVEGAVARFEAARAAHLDLITPRTFERAARQLDAARQRFEAGRKTPDVESKLAEFDREMSRCEGLREIGEVLLRTALAARADALASNAPGFSADLWAQAEKAIRQAGRKVEDGDQNAARREAGKAAGLYRDVELEAIRGQVLGPTRAERGLAAGAGAELLAPATVASADSLLGAAERILKNDRYRQAEARELAESAAEAYRHAAWIAGLVARHTHEKEIRAEQIVLLYEIELARVARQLRFEPHFTAGAEPVTDEILAAVASLAEDRDRLQAKLDETRAEMEELDARLAALEERDAQLRVREKREQRLRDVQALFERHEAEVLISGGQLILRLHGLSFPSGSAEIRPESFSLLTKVRRALLEFPKMPVTIEGHTDSQGNDDYNLELSQRRANAVREYLLANMGIEADWVVAVGHGENRPIASNEIEEGRARNRRIDVVVELVGI